MATKDITNGITRNEVRLLHFIRTYQAAHIHMPANPEMETALGMSRSNTARVIKRLKDRKLLRRDGGTLAFTAAGIELRLPEKVD